jgi:hypothetical protein
MRECGFGVICFVLARNKLKERPNVRIAINGRIAVVASVMMAPLMLISGEPRAQDVPGIEICTVEKTMERRTSCLQSNVDFLQKTITKLAAENRQKLDAAKAQIDGLKSALVSLQRTVDDLHAAQNKVIEDQKKKLEPSPAKDNAPLPKDVAK